MTNKSNKPKVRWHSWAVRRRAFRLWQRRPHRVAPMSEQTSRCACCGTEFTGNFCPRCGQAAGVERFSFKQALSLFLDVFDVNNRSIFRTFRDLLLRPGYMARDYVKGMQAAYFSPFKLFFMLATASLIVDQIVDKEAEEDDAVSVSAEAKDDASADAVSDNDSVTLTMADSVSKSVSKEQAEPAGEESVEPAGEENSESTDKDLADKGESRKSKMRKAVDTLVDTISDISDENPAILSLLALVLFSLPLFLFFRRSPAFPGLRFPEFMVAQICSYNVLTVYSMLGNLLDLSLLQILSYVAALVALKQFTGCSKRRIAFAFFVAGIVAFMALLGLILLAIYIMSLFN